MICLKLHKEQNRMGKRGEDLLKQKSTLALSVFLGSGIVWQLVSWDT